MLLLTRKIAQSILIGDDVEVRVLQVRDDGTVQLGIDAPKSIRILRDELKVKPKPIERAPAPANEDAPHEDSYKRFCFLRQSAAQDR